MLSNNLRTPFGWMINRPPHCSKQILPHFTGNRLMAPSNRYENRRWQRLIEQSMSEDRPNIANPISVKLLIRFQIPISKLPRQFSFTTNCPLSHWRARTKMTNEAIAENPQTGLSGLRSSVAPQEHKVQPSSVERDETKADTSLRFHWTTFDGRHRYGYSARATHSTGRNTTTGGASFRRGFPVDVPEHYNQNPQPKKQIVPPHLASTEPRGPHGRLVFQTDEQRNPAYAIYAGIGTHHQLTCADHLWCRILSKITCDQFMSSEVRYKDLLSEDHCTKVRFLTAKTPSSTGINCSVRPVCSGDFGAHHMNLLSRTTSMAVGG